MKYPHIAAKWREESAYMVLLGVPDESALTDWSARLCRLPHLLNLEPDRENEATALCIGPEEAGPLLSDCAARRALSNLPLLLREPAMA